MGMKWLNELPEGDKGQRSKSLCHPPTRRRQKPGGGAAGRALGGQPTDGDTHPSNTEGNKYSRAKSHPQVFRNRAVLPRPFSILNPRHVSAGLTVQWTPRTLLLTQHWLPGYPPPGPGAEGRGRGQPPPFPGICQPSLKAVPRPRPSGLRSPPPSGGMHTVIMHLDRGDSTQGRPGRPARTPLRSQGHVQLSRQYQRPPPQGWKTGGPCPPRPGGQLIYSLGISNMHRLLYFCRSSFLVRTCSRRRCSCCCCRSGLRWMPGMAPTTLRISWNLVLRAFRSCWTSGLSLSMLRRQRAGVSTISPDSSILASPRQNACRLCPRLGWAGLGCAPGGRGGFLPVQP